jgi:hypothetical protein
MLLHSYTKDALPETKDQPNRYAEENTVFFFKSEEPESRCPE